METIRHVRETTMTDFDLPLEIPEEVIITLRWRITDPKKIKKSNILIEEWVHMVKQQLQEYINNHASMFPDEKPVKILELCIFLWFDEQYLSFIENYGIVLVEIFLGRENDVLMAEPSSK